METRELQNGGSASSPESVTRLWVDVWDYDAKRAWRTISKWASTIDISAAPARYRHCPECSRIAVDTTLSLEEVEARLDRGSLDYIGVCERKDYFKKDGYLFDSINTCPASEL